MAISIGKLALQLTASPAGLISGLNTGLKSIDGFAASAGKAFANLANPPALKALQGSFKKAFAPVLEEGGVFEQIAEIGRTADALGLGTEDLIAFQKAAGRAGLAPEQLTRGLMALQRTLGKATLMDDAAADGFDTFGNHAEKAGSVVSASMRKLAGDLGLPVGTLLGLERAGLTAGVSTESLAGALKNLDASLGGTGQAGEKFIGMAGKMIPDADAVRLFGAGAADALKVLAQGPEALKKSVKDATDELTKGLKGLEKFGLDPDALALKPFGETVRIISDKFKELPSAAEKMQLAMSFGRGGQGFVRMLEGGREGLDAMLAKAELLGTVFTRAEALRVQQAKGAVGTINDAFKGIKMQLAIQLAPVVTALTENFTVWLKSIGGIPAIIKGIANTAYGIADAVLAMVQGTLELVEGVKGATGKGGILGAVLGAGAGGLAVALGASVVGLPAALALGAVGGNLLGRSFDQAADSGDRAADAVGKLRDRLRELREGATAEGGGVKPLTERLETQLKEAQTQQGDLAKKMAGKRDPGRVMMDALTGNMGAFESPEEMKDPMERRLARFAVRREKLMQAAFDPDALKKLIEGGGRVGLAALDLLPEGMKPDDLLGPGMAEKWKAQLDALVKKLDVDLGKSKGADLAGGRLKHLGDVTEQLKSSTDDYVDSLHRQVSTFGQDEGAQKLYEIDQKRVAILAELAKQTDLVRAAEGVIGDKQQAELAGKIGLVRGQLAELDGRKELIGALGDELKARQKNHDLMSKGKQLTEELRSPLEQFNARQDELAKLVQQGAVTWGVYEKAVNKAAEALGNASQQKDNWNAGAAVLEGSGAAISAMNQARFGDTTGNASVQKILADNKAQLERATNGIMNVVGAVKDIGANIVDALKPAKNFIPGA